MPDAPPESTVDQLTDRALLEHVARRVEALWLELEQFRPLLTMIRGADGRPDMVGVLQARRELRRGRRG